MIYVDVNYIYGMHIALQFYFFALSIWFVLIPAHLKKQKTQWKGNASYYSNSNTNPVIHRKNQISEGKKGMDIY